MSLKYEPASEPLHISVKSTEPHWQAAVLGARTLQLLEDIYLPHRPKRKTKASDARDKGLQVMILTPTLVCS